MGLVSGHPRRGRAAAPALTVEAQYPVGEYGNLILSAEERGGLKTWLVRAGYRRAEGAGGRWWPRLWPEG